MLSIPYLTRTGVTAIRFRRLGSEDSGPKYRSEPGEPPRIFNANALLQPSPFIAICEGEFDAMAAHEAGIPAVGIAGVSAWKDYFARCFKGYSAVYILTDADDKGQGLEFGEKVAAQIKNARISPMPEGHDVNSFVLENGHQALLDRLEIKTV
jgi:DNA primase